MLFDKELSNNIIRYIGDIEQSKPYFPIKEVKIPNYSSQEIYDCIALMIEGNLIHGIFADDNVSDRYGYLIGGLTTESRYLYNQLKEIN